MSSLHLRLLRRRRRGRGLGEEEGRKVEGRKGRRKRRGRKKRRRRGGVKTDPLFDLPTCPEVSVGGAST